MRKCFESVLRCVNIRIYHDHLVKKAAKGRAINVLKAYPSPHAAAYIFLIQVFELRGKFAPWFQYLRASPVAQLVKNRLQSRRPGLHPWVGKIPWRRERLPTPVFWPGVHGVTKSWARLSDFHFTFSTYPVWPWADFLTYLSFSFVICTMESSY